MDRSNVSKWLRELEDKKRIVQLRDGRWIKRPNVGSAHTLAILDGDAAVAVQVPPIVLSSVLAHVKTLGPVTARTIHLEIVLDHEK